MSQVIPQAIISRILPAFLVCCFASVASSQQAPLFIPGNLVVSVEGNGVVGDSGAYSDNQASPLTLFQYHLNAANPTNAPATYINSVVFPQTASGANLPVSGEYGSSSEGSIQLDGTGRYLTIMGYGINANLFNGNPNAYSATANSALAQSGSLTGQSYTPVARVVTLVDPFGNVNSSTALYNIFSTNNPRSIYTATGAGNAYVSGQGGSGDATGGVFYVPLFGANSSPVAITGLDSTNNTVSQDTRFVSIHNGTLYVSVDSKAGSGAARSFIGTLGTPPATSLYSNAAGPTQIASANNAGTPVAITSTGKTVLTASEVNGINATGQTINLSPEAYFFANAYTLYIADSGSPKQNSASTLLGDGGLQKWINTKTDGSGTWKLVYTLASGLNLVANNASNSSDVNGTTGLESLTGVVVGGNVELFATNYTIADLDPSFLYSITDPLAATANPGTSFTAIATAPADSNFKGVSFAPVLPAGSATITSTPSGLTFTTTGTGCTPGTYSTPQTLLWTPGSSCTLSVVGTQTAQGTHYLFTQWQDETTGTSDVVTAPSASSVYSATFSSNYKSLGNLEQAVDASTSSSTVPSTDKVFISGWVADPVDGSPVSNVSVLIDGKSIGAPTLGLSRPDVASYYSNSAYANSGYQVVYPASSLAVGTHAVTVTVVNSNGVSTTFGPVSFTVTAVYPSPVGNLEQAKDATTGSTTVSQADQLYVGGWAADPTDTTLQSLNVYIDGTLSGPATTGISRPDVATATGVAAYGNSGFSYYVSAGSLSVGTHSVTVVGTDSHGNSTTYGPLPISVAAVQKAPVGNLDKAVDSATGSSTVSASGTLYVGGWAADYQDNGPAQSVSVSIDGVVVGSATLGGSRPDVASYYNNPAWSNTGYALTYSASSLSTGGHTVTATATDSLGLTTTFGPIAFSVQ